MRRETLFTINKRDKLQFLCVKNSIRTDDTLQNSKYLDNILQLKSSSNESMKYTICKPLNRKSLPNAKLLYLSLVQYQQIRFT